jgi:hypothetical protein
MVMINKIILLGDKRLLKLAVMLLINSKKREACNNNKSLIIHKVQLLFLKIILVSALNDNYVIFIEK